MKDIKESQQTSQGINIGNSGNQGGSMPEGAKGIHQKQTAKEEQYIPNQERSSAKNSREKEGE
jgi:hypothetical protein